MMMITNELARRNNNKKKTIREVSQSSFCRFKIFQLFFFLKEKRNSQIPSAAQV
jgi:hypothetical protein